MTDILARYTFLPWMRRGLSTKIKEKDNFNDFTSTPADGWTLERPEMLVKVNVESSSASATDSEQIEQQIKIIGPGDIIGIDKRIIVKVEPKNWITNYEPNYFPYIEFYEEDFPWRYSPASPEDNKLRPWLTLVVLKENEFTKDEVLFDKLPSITVNPAQSDPEGTTGATSSALPDPGQLWAWTHVHLNGDVDATNALNPTNSDDLDVALDRFRELLAANPDQAVARMMCPRKLDANTTYHAFLIPTFETGRLAGLGVDTEIIATHKAQEAAFGTEHSTDADHQLFADHFPVYYEWQFGTSDIGDFESLVRLLQPSAVDRQVGKREMNIQKPGYGVEHGPGQIHNNGMLYLEGALIPPRTGTLPDRETYPWSKEPADINYVKSMAQLVNLGEDIRKATFDPEQFYNNNPFGYEDGEDSLEDDPIISPDLYGRWHALKDKLESKIDELNGNDSWLYEANLDPRSRAVAGLGVQHVKKNQEKLMDAAWGQMGDVIEANRKLKWGQIAKKVSQAGFKKNICSQKPEQFNAMVGKVFKRVRFESKTAYKAIRNSAISNATQSFAYRKIERPQSPVMKRLDPNSAVFTQNSLRESMGNGSLKAVETKVISPNQADVQLSGMSENVSTIANYNVGRSRFGTSSPNSSTFVANINSELRFKKAITPFKSYFEMDNWLDKKDAPTITLKNVVDTVIPKIDPKYVLPRRVNGKVSMPTQSSPTDKIVPVMAYPFFDKPMYEAVRDLGVDYLIPNLDLIPNNSITLLESNQKFIEAFMLGLNHEMGRELLWREFPTDQRGSYFQQFWDSSDAVATNNQSAEELATEGLDIEEIHKWPVGGQLGSNSLRSGADTGLLVLVVRGDLLKKYPETVIYAQKASFSGDNNGPRVLDAQKSYPLFSAQIEPDIYFLGFNLSAAEIKGNRNDNDAGWFFIIKERPGEIRFGLDIDGISGRPSNWNNLHQGNAAYNGQHLEAGDESVRPLTVVGSKINDKVVKWGFNSTNFAQILYQNPVLLAVHGDEMIP